MRRKARSALLKIPDPVRRPVNTNIGYSIAIVVRCLRDVAFPSELDSRKCTVHAREAIPDSALRPKHGDLRNPVPIEIKRQTLTAPGILLAGEDNNCCGQQRDDGEKQVGSKLTHE
ncbi:MAG: hypothetical protein DWQ47_03505 [Acidobacteria bacterium]|nr:MAG: hypothetical protein DWQ32_07055 [Acidobacteriota bacterium]REK01467.1 MAG: hypothetical protein DWQ38_03490 [Acidobacteriota bacterium]REK14423.1 MAG: hypothetical protein DWQ43_12745 [Acidobacteriota bacterium]REK45138.1 MAG: hypothetical protein DWQ47_03505 [Acidobacteriota bacterium]